MVSSTSAVIPPESSVKYNFPSEEEGASASLLGVTPVSFLVKKSRAPEGKEDLSNIRQDRLKKRHGMWLRVAVIGIREQQILLCLPEGKASPACLHGSGGRGLRYKGMGCVTKIVQT